MYAWRTVSGCPNFNPGVITPTCVVIHYTAGSLESTLGWFLSPISKVSSHVIIDCDGTLYGVVPTTCVAWHAGVSTWRGVDSVNRFSIGIELVSTSEHQYTYTNQQYECLRTYLWGGDFLTDTGVETHTGVATALGLQDHPIGVTDADILGHEHVSPGRKFDPGLSFDWSRITRPIPAVKWWHYFLPWIRHDRKNRHYGRR